MFNNNSPSFSIINNDLIFNPLMQMKVKVNHYRFFHCAQAGKKKTSIQQVVQREKSLKICGMRGISSFFQGKVRNFL